MRYNADEQPDPEAWLNLSEAERIELIIEYHNDLDAPAEASATHSAAHVFVENQIALGDATSVPETLERLLGEGITRHEAIHAIGSVLIELMCEAVHDSSDERDLTALYNQRLAALSAKSWSSQGC